MCYPLAFSLLDPSPPSPLLLQTLQYKLLVYVTQTKHVTAAKIDASFKYTVS